jgi:lipoate-protein ligase B
MSLPCWTIRSGLIGYRDALKIQRLLFTARRAGLIEDVQWLLEHPPTITTGKRGDARGHLVADERELTRLGIPVVETDRGGDITYHGPGQLIGYMIFDLNRRYQDVFRFLREVEEVLIRVLHTWGVAGQRREGLTGVWVGDMKIASIGIKMSWWVTMHGFALNVASDLSGFDHIIPCGIENVGMTSLTHQVKHAVSLDEVASRVIEQVEAVFGAVPIPRCLDEILEQIA